METNRIINPNSKKNLIDNPEYFGAYLNTARHRLYITLEGISTQLGLPNFPTDEGQLLEAKNLFNLLSGKKQPDKTLTLQNEIRRYFPFFEVILHYKTLNRKDGINRDVEPKDYAEVLETLIKQLNAYRNYYTHAIHPEIEHDKKVVWWMQELFDAAGKKVRTKNNYGDEDMKHLKRRAEEVKTGEFDRKGKEKIKHVEAEKYHYAFYNEKDKKISEKGLAFFICMFLEKGDDYAFLKKLKGFKSGVEKNHKATLEVYTFYKMKLPIVKLESSKSGAGLLLDMVNELGRCPAPMYDLLQPSDKRLFIKDHEIFNDEALDESSDENIQPQSILKRHDDRFPYFAIRFIDETNAFKKLRFNIDLGNYYFSTYHKPIDGENRIRRLKHAVRSFGKLEDFETEKRPESWNEIIKKTNELDEDYDQPYFTDTQAHYHIINNQIGLKELKDTTDKDKLWPDITVTLKDNKPVRPKNEEADIWLSLNEIPAMLFYQLLSGQSENLIFDHRKKIKKFFEAIVNKEITNLPEMELHSELALKYGLNKWQIPEALWEYLTTIPKVDENKLRKERLEKLISDTKYKIDKHKERIQDLKKSKPGKKTFRPIKPGNLADFIARDILKMQAPVDEKKGKATGTLFQVLQSRIAYFSRDKELLYSLFKECNLIESSNPHPFLNKLLPLNYVGVNSFYDGYLKARLNYLEQLRQNKDLSNVHILRLSDRDKTKQSDYYIKLAKKFLKDDQQKIPMSLPVGLFKTAIIEWFKENGSDNIKRLIAENKKVNFVYLIEKHLAEMMGENEVSQVFYDYKRNYKIIDKIIDKNINKIMNERSTKTNRPVPKKYFTVADLASQYKTWQAKVNQMSELHQDQKNEKEKFIRLFNDYIENEKLIRHIKATDMVLFLMVKELWNQQDEGLRAILKNYTFKLKEINPDNEKGILSKQGSFELAYTYLDESNNKITKRITQEELQIKKYSEFRRFVKDRRLPSLMPLISNQTIARELLQKELSIYENARMKAFKIIYDFEVAMDERYPDLRKVILDNPNKNHATLLDEFFKHYPEFAENRTKMENLRNKFSHNQYPDYSIFKTAISSENLALILSADNEKHSVAGQLLNFVEETYLTYTEILKK